MDRAIVFLDGGYLDHIIKDFGKRINYRKLAIKLCGNDALTRTYYYHCLPYQSNPPTFEERERFRKASSFFDKLKRLDRFEIRLGKLVKRGTYANGNPILNQKRVDVYLATDVVKFSAHKSMDQIILLTSDSDYVPAIDAAKEFGIIVKLAYYENLDINQELLDACDECFKFNPTYLTDLIIKPNI